MAKRRIEKRLWRKRWGLLPELNEMDDLKLVKRQVTNKWPEKNRRKELSWNMSLEMSKWFNRFIESEKEEMVGLNDWWKEKEKVERHIRDELTKKEKRESEKRRIQRMIEKRGLPFLQLVV